MTADRRVFRILVVVVLLGAAWIITVPAGASDGVVLAQDPNTEEDVVGEEEEAEGQESGNQENIPEESGADEGETQGTAEETGPPWTYQMARLGILLVLLMVLGVGFAYYRFVVRRQRGAV